MMSLDELIPEEQANALVDSPSEVTIEDLFHIYGRGAVKRGLSYMASLDEAEENYKESVDESSYGEDMAESVVEDSNIVPEERKQDLQDKWGEAMNEEGLGLDE